MENIVALSSFSFQHLILVFIELYDIELGVLTDSVQVRG